MTELTAKLELQFEDSDTTVVSFSPFNPETFEPDAFKQRLRTFNASDVSVISAFIKNENNRSLTRISGATVVVSDETVIYGGE